MVSKAHVGVGQGQRRTLEEPSLPPTTPGRARAPDVPGRQRLLLARRGQSGVPWRGGDPPGRDRDPRLGGRARRVLQRLRRLLRRAVAEQRPRSPAPGGSRVHLTRASFRGTCYRRLPASSDPRAAWIFEGIDDEVLGDFGLSGGGAAGFELDRLDTNLGSPRHALTSRTPSALTHSTNSGTAGATSVLRPRVNTATSDPTLWTCTRAPSSLYSRAAVPSRRIASA